MIGTGKFGYPGEKVLALRNSPCAERVPRLIRDELGEVQEDKYRCLRGVMKFSLFFSCPDHLAATKMHRYCQIAEETVNRVSEIARALNSSVTCSLVAGC